MTKKLFVVLVVISALLITFSFVIAAKKAPLQKGPPQVYEKQTIVRQQATSMPKGTLTEQLNAENLYPDRGTKATATTAEATVSSGRIEAGPLNYTKDFCDLYGVPAYYITDWFWGMEWYANFQNPEDYGCVDVWPFEVVDVGFDIDVPAAMDIDVQGFVYDNAGDLACPFPGTEVCQTPIYTVSIPAAGWWTISLPMQELCCVYEPYFAVIYIYTDLAGLGADAIAEDDPTDICNTYNDYGNGWEDLVVDYGWPGEMILWSTGYTEPQNDCEAPEPECRLQHDNGSATGFFSGWSVGDQNAIYYDPVADCECDPVYPLMITQVEGRFYDYAGVGTVDVIFHFYEAGELCEGPGVEIYSFEATITTFHPQDAVVPVPDLLCLEDDFFLACEYNSGTTGSIPSLLFDNQQEMVDTCYQWNDYIDYGWIEWWDFWAPPIPGWLMLRAVGTCDASDCYPGEVCDLVQDPGIVNSYFGGFAAGDAIAKYFDPEDALFACTPPVYPYRIADVEFDLYDFGGMGAVDVIINVELECQGPCDGPGPQIYQSDPITVTTFHPNLAHIDLPEVVCVYEPFFITIEYATGAQGSTPSFVWANEAYPCDTCHAWMYWASGGYDFWIEWNDFWAPPAGGCPIIRVSGYTESPACDVPPCPEDVMQLAGGATPVSVWPQPDAYGDNFRNERFEMPVAHGGRLDYFEIAFYQASSAGFPDPDFYVWQSDGLLPLDNNAPYQAIADFHIAYEDIVWYSGWTTVQTYSQGIEFDPGEKFHIGYSHAEVDPADVLALLGTGSVGSDRASEWYAGTWYPMSTYWTNGDIDFLIHAYICPGPVVAPTFSMKCVPSVGYATPGDPPADVYQIRLASINEYDLPVTLSLLSVDPAEDITVTFDPVTCTPPCTSDVAITVGGGVSYGDYTLTFQGVGTDDQTKICDVTLTVQPPYDEGLVHFYHGAQKMTNYGALGDDHYQDNFLWYDREEQLWDATLISVVPIEPYRDHFAMDVYDCEHLGFIPTQQMVITDDPKWPANIGYAEFYTDPDIIDTEWDSVFVIGIMDSCVDFSIKIKIYYNPTEAPIPALYAGIFEDWDVAVTGQTAHMNWGDMDTLHNLAWIYNLDAPEIVFGCMKAPFYDDLMNSIIILDNDHYVHENSGFCDDVAGWHGLDTLYELMTTPRYRGPADYGLNKNDKSLLMTAPPFSLNPGEKHIEIWIDFGRNLNDGMTWEQWSHRVLRYAGFYRGDVNASDTLDQPQMDVSDLVYLINYLYKGGAAPLPFVDQGDVDGQPFTKDFNDPKNNVDLADFLYMLNYIFKGGPPPVDYVRFIPSYWSRPSLFFSPFNEWPAP